ncbi:GntR family transcriptional regulator [Paenibacillus glucanolyticus]|uniref:TrkA C-terminal domain-containing protein n=1 Tax=Paenibacillus TaxID=44249 RepID=UPI0003E1C13B|nr:MULTISPECIES: TrkA C-terminal domain-containing protein [Paenibacillus]ANA78498.1 GntR family transcriptional regulator [Paenibacillus glucanolyticus]AVV57587.1 GntR family transcriptional regulator [Paenibacillus glucanolyticus]ETT34354.1 TrkA-C domain-containing protein [Paenibacillus sp. FSL R5-808]
MQEKAGYKSIALDIAQRIVSGEFPVASKISGRSLLAGQYQVSPETIRKAIGLLKEENIVSVSQGKEIIIISDRNALEYTTRNNYLKSAYSLKQDLQQLLQEKKEMDRKFAELFTQIIEASDRLQNLKPYHPVEIKISDLSHVIGRTIGNLLFWQNTGATIIALRRGTEVTISPGPHVILREGDIIVAVGDERMYERTEQFINRPLDEEIQATDPS